MSFWVDCQLLTLLLQLLLSHPSAPKCPVPQGSVTVVPLFSAPSSVRSWPTSVLSDHACAEDSPFTSQPRSHHCLLDIPIEPSSPPADSCTHTSPPHTSLQSMCMDSNGTIPPDAILPPILFSDRGCPVSATTLPCLPHFCPLPHSSTCSLLHPDHTRTLPMGPALLGRPSHPLFLKPPGLQVLLHTLPVHATSH